MAEPYIIDNRFGVQTVRTGSDEFIPESSYSDNLWNGIKSGFQETTIGLAKDVALKQRAKAGINLIEQEDWNETHPYYVEDLEWYDDLSVDIAKNIRDYQGQLSEKQKIYQRANGYGKALNFGGQFIGAMIDPINIIPLGFGATTLARAGKIGLASMALETAVYTPLFEYTEEVRNRDLGLEDYALNAAFAFGAGAGLSLLGSGIAGIPNFVRSMATGKTNNPQKKKIINDIDKNIKDDASTIASSNLKIDINRLSAQGRSKQVFGSASSSANFIRNLDVSNIGRSVYVDSKGLMYANADADRIKLDITNDGIVLTGNTKISAKLLPTITELAPDQNIRIVNARGDVEVITPQMNATRTTQLLEENAITSTALGGDKITRYRVEIGDTKFDLEFDSVTGEIIAGYNVILKGKKNPQWRRGKALNSEELDTLSKAFEADTANWINTTNKNSRSINETADAVIEDARGGRESLNENADRVETKLNETGDEDFAVELILGKSFDEALEEGDVVGAILSLPGISETSIKEVGFRIVKENNRRKFVPLKDFDSSKLDAEQSALQREIDDLIEYKRKTKLEEQAEKELNVCMTRNGAGAV